MRGRIEPKRTVSIMVVAATGLLLGACGDVNRALDRTAEARALAGDLTFEFGVAAAAGDRAVMADTDGQSAAFARESQETQATVDADVTRLRRILSDLGDADITALLDQFVERFAEYRRAEATLLGLAVENTNLKAQKLSFGAAREAVEAFRRSLDTVRAAHAADQSRVEVLIATAERDLLQIETLEAPHIAETSNDAMTRLEQQMAQADTSLRGALTSLRPLVADASTARLDAAAAAFERFVSVHKDILMLSRRNTNVRSLAMALAEKPPLVAACQDRLRAIRDALDKRQHVGQRWP